MSEMKLIMENFRKFSEQNTCDGGQCRITIPPQTAEEIEADIKQIKQQMKTHPAHAKFLNKVLADKEAELKQLKSQQVKEQAGETDPDLLGLRNFGNIASIDGYRGFEGESMENNQKTYKHLFANLKSAQTGKKYIEMALTRTRDGRDLAKKNISLISAKVLQPKNSSFSMNSASLPRLLKVVWDVGNQIPQNKAKEAEDTLVTPTEVMP